MDRAASSGTGVKVANTFTRIIEITDGGASGFNADAEIWWCPSVTLAGGISPYVLTVNTNLVSNKNLYAKIFQVRGAVLDQSGTANGSAGTSATVTAGSVDTSTTNFVVAAIAMGFGSSALADPATTSNPVAFTSGYLSGASFEVSYRFNATAVTDNASWTWVTNDSYASVLASFKGSPALIQNFAGIKVTATSLSFAFGQLPTAGDAIIVVLGAGPWNPAFNITGITDNQTQGYVPMGGLPQVEMHWRDG